MSKKLIVYYSHSGNTRKGAELIRKITGADTLELKPVDEYPRDLWATVDIFKEELKNGTKPAIKSYNQDASQYDIIYIGTPNWGDTVATPLRTFFEAVNLTNKRIMPFVTHGGGGVGNCADDIVRLSGSINHGKALVYSGSSINEKKVEQWLKANNQ